MKLMLATLALNEIQWLEKLYKQHKDFPNLQAWVFVESADIVYARTNPHMVSSDGLSVDGTTSFLQELEQVDSKVIHIPYGYTRHADLAQCKCAARNAYLDVAHAIKPDYIIIIDADEFWPKHSQDILERWLLQDASKLAFSFKHREIWYPPYYEEHQYPLFKSEVIGGFWNILYCRAWKYIPNMGYRLNHNTPDDGRGHMLTDKLQLHNRPSKDGLEAPEYIHMGFASSSENRIAKNTYYENRGEANDPKRKWYTESRALWEDWNPSVRLPKGAQVVSYSGLIPEIFNG